MKQTNDKSYTGCICVECGKPNAMKGSMKHPYCKECFGEVWNNNIEEYLKFLSHTHSHY